MFGLDFNWLHDQNNRETAAWFGSLAVALLGGGKYLLDFLRRKPTPPPPGTSSTKTDPRETYLRLLASEWRALPLDVLDPNAADPHARRLSLERIYIALDTTSPRPEKLKAHNGF